MIRKLEKADTERVMSIWLRGNLEAHPFIAEEYWISHYESVKGQLFQAEVYVLEKEGELQGFIGIADGYIAGIFTDSSCRSMGVGRRLIQWAKGQYGSLSLSVYQENTGAVRFYLREGFTVSREGVDQETGHIEYTMTWEKGL